MENGINHAWQAKKAALIGTQITIPGATIDAIRLPNGNTITSPYNSRNEIANSEEASRYVGQTGTIVDVSFQQRDVQMIDGAIVILIVPEER